MPIDLNRFKRRDRVIELPHACRASDGDLGFQLRSRPLGTLIRAEKVLFRGTTRVPVVEPWWSTLGLGIPKSTTKFSTKDTIAPRGRLVLDNEWVGP